MGEYFPAHIRIGGELNPAQAAALLEFIQGQDGLSQDYGDSTVDFHTVDDMLAAIDDDGFLHFRDCAASWGEFEELEAELRELRIPFDRESDPYHEYDGKVRKFRPGPGEEPLFDDTFLANADGDELVDAKVVDEAIEALINMQEAAGCHQALEILRKARPEVPVMPKLQLVA
jgi:hypothetical protein